MKQNPATWVWKENKSEPWVPAQRKAERWWTSVSKPTFHLAGNSNPIWNMVGLCKSKTCPSSLLGYTVASFAIQLLCDLICIGMLNQFWTSLGFLSIFFPLVVSFSYVNIDCSSYLQSEVQSWKIHVTSVQKSFWRTFKNAYCIP